MTTTVLFDLDGTLLPMDQDLFVRSYFKMMAVKVAPFGYDAHALVDAIWKGTAAMARNDGTETNEEAFWKCFASLLGERVYRDKPLFDEFYAKEFQNARSVCGYTPRANECVQLVRSLGLRVALATNPLFPAVATMSRIGWAGLKPEDFEFVTTYENSSFAKPNPAYYTFVAETLGVKPEECLMVGNDAAEDTPASSVGMKVFILTDCLMNADKVDISPYPHGSFPELMEYIKALKA